MAAAFRRNYVRLVTEYCPHPLVILSDASRIRFVLLALLQNACDAIASSGEGGQILIRMGRDERGCALIEIENEGKSLPAEARSKLFEPFITTKPEGKGAGLGLFLVQHFVTELQGKVKIHDTETGTKVTLTLPSLALL
jgi:two-component system C4-dicarboxylate transport sensor histidine kinase DctB